MIGVADQLLRTTDRGEQPLVPLAGHRHHLIYIGVCPRHLHVADLHLLSKMEVDTRISHMETSMTRAVGFTLYGMKPPRRYAEATLSIRCVSGAPAATGRSHEERQHKAYLCPTPRLTSTCQG